jgi:PAS domain S-box-containing protein
MDDGSLVEKAISRIIAINSTAPEGETEQRLAGALSETFGIEKVSIKSDPSFDGSTLYGYVANTKRPYVDNQLSQYSSFPELTCYWTSGEKSCAVIPVLVCGRMVSMVELLSKTENKFSEELISGVSVAAYLIGLSAVYRKEESKSLRLAGYFNSAFGAPPMQMLVSNDGTVVKSNPDAVSRFGDPSQGRLNISALFEADLKSIKERAKTGKEMLTRSKSEPRTYAIHSSEAAPNLNHISVRDATDQERLASIIDSMGPGYGAGVLFLNKDLTVSYATASIKKIIGYESTLTVSKSVLDLIPEREKVRFSEIVAELGKAHRATGSIGMITDKGTISPVRFTISNSPGGYLLMFYDASAERYIESMSAAFNDFLDNSSDLVIKIDELGYIKSLNPSAEQALGYEKGELMGRAIRPLYSDPTILEQDLAYVRNGNRADNSYIKLRTKDEREVGATSSIRLFKAGDSTEFVIMARELETRKKLKEQEEIMDKQQNKIKKLESTGEMKSQFIYNISHELKTPLTSIVGFSKLLYSGEFGPMNQDQLEYISTIMNESDRLMGIIAQVLDAAKLESEKVNLELAEVDLRELEESPSIKALKESAKNKGLELQWSVDYDVPPVLADRGRLIQIFVNLIGNSIKFTEKGTINVKISRRSRKIECNVLDTGIGISDDFRIRKFYDAPKSAPIKQEGSGTGLGLSITREIVHLHGGEIRYERRPEGGSRFWFTLPIKGKRKSKQR